MAGVFSDPPGCYRCATGRSLEDLLAALAEAISVFVARLREPYSQELGSQELCSQESTAPGTLRAASPPDRDYF